QIAYGAQITDFINIKLTGIGTRFGKSTVVPMTACRRVKPTPEANMAAESDAGRPSVRDFLDAGWSEAR
ncbi:MAG TPA: hypothetical protein VEZ40_20080, partial [Pyrinomonadaceae bacterium]|nr:hypothetical protein [Pyrinomonadaceae bacterium]